MSMDSEELPPVVIGTQAVRLYLVGAGFDLRGPYGCYATAGHLAALLAALPAATLKHVLEQELDIRHPKCTECKGTGGNGSYLRRSDP